MAAALTARQATQCAEAVATINRLTGANFTCGRSLPCGRSCPCGVLSPVDQHAVENCTGHNLQRIREWLAASFTLIDDDGGAAEGIEPATLWLLIAAVVALAAAAVGLTVLLQRGHRQRGPPAARRPQRRSSPAVQVRLSRNPIYRLDMPRGKAGNPIFTPSLSPQSPLWPTVPGFNVPTPAPVYAECEAAVSAIGHQLEQP